MKVSLAERCLSKLPVHRTFISRMRKKLVLVLSDLYDIEIRNMVFVDDRKNLYHCFNQECHKVIVTILVLIIRSSHTIFYGCCRSLHRRWSLSEVVL